MRILLTLLILGTSVCLFAQSEKSLTAEFKSTEDILQSVEGKTTSSFTLETDKQSLDMLLDLAGKMGPNNILTATPTKGEEGKYDMTLSFSYDAPIQSVHKMLLSYGFTAIKIDNKEYPLNHLLTLKK